jgi:ATP-dependent exoDNAse (exonuclease V) alpha subunit
MIQPGELVMITRASVGVTAGTIGFILREHKGNIDGKTIIYDVDIVGVDRRPRRYLARDLKVIK